MSDFNIYPSGNSTPNDSDRLVGHISTGLQTPQGWNFSNLRTWILGFVPTANSVTIPSTNITDSTVIGRTILTAADDVSVRASINVYSKTETDTAISNATILSSNIADATTIGKAILTATDDVSVRTSINAYSKAETDSAIANATIPSSSITDASTIGKAILTDPDDISVRSSISVYSKAEVDSAISNSAGSGIVGYQEVTTPSALSSTQSGYIIECNFSADSTQNIDSGFATGTNFYFKSTGSGIVKLTATDGFEDGIAEYYLSTGLALYTYKNNNGSWSVDSIPYRDNETATVAPSATDDQSKGYVALYSKWRDGNTTPATIYICDSDTVGAAHWTEVGGGGGTGIPTPPKFDVIENFLNYSKLSYLNVTKSGGNGLPAGVQGRGGVIDVKATNSGDYVVYVNDMNSIIFGGGLIAKSSGEINIPTLMDTTDDGQIFLGWFDYSAGDPKQSSDAAFLLHDSTSPNWQLCTSYGNNSRMTVFDSGVAVVAGSWLSLAVEVSADGLTCNAYLNGAQIASTTTNVPGTHGANNLGAGFGITKTNGTTARDFLIDWHRIQLS